MLIILNMIFEDFFEVVKKLRKNVHGLQKSNIKYGLNVAKSNIKSLGMS